MPGRCQLQVHRHSISTHFHGLTDALDQVQVAVTGYESRKIVNSGRARTVFVGSPSDMAHERRVIADVVHALNMELNDTSQVELYLYEEDERVLDATEAMQAQLIGPLRNASIGICLFGERIGTPLSDGFVFPGECLADAIPAPVTHPWPVLEPTPDALPLTGTVFELFYFRQQWLTSTSESGRKSLFVLLSGGPEVLNAQRAMHERKFGQHRWLKHLRAGGDEASEEVEAEYRQQRRWVANLIDAFGKTDMAVERFDAVADEAGFRQLIEDRIRQGLGLNRSKVNDSGPGLAPVSNPADLHGRDVELERLREVLLKDNQLLILHGLPGVGKSSVLKAGLVPALRSPKRWPELGKRAVSMIRAQDLESTDSLIWKNLAVGVRHWLADLLGDEKVDRNLSDVFNDLTVGPDRLCSYIGSLLLAADKEEKLILVLDQFEQILAKLLGEHSESEHANAQAVYRFLGKFCSRPWGQVVVALPNAWHELISCTGVLKTVSGYWDGCGAKSVPFMIDQPDDRGRRHVIKRFFSVRDISVDSRVQEELATQASKLVKQTVSTSVMPALAITLKQMAELYTDQLSDQASLWSRPLETQRMPAEKAQQTATESQVYHIENAQSNQLTLESCAGLLDLQSAIARLAEDAWRQYELSRRAGFHTQRAVNQILAMLTEIDVDDKGLNPQPIRSLRSVRRSVIVNDNQGKELLDLVDALVSCRIMIDEAGMLSLVHECVLDSWKIASDWYAGRAWNQLVLRQIRKLSDLWQATNHQRFLFLPGDQFEFPGCEDLLPKSDDSTRTRTAPVMDYSDLECVWGMEYDTIRADAALLDFTRTCLLEKTTENCQHGADQSLYWVGGNPDLQVLEHYLQLYPHDLNRPRQKDQRVPLHCWSFNGDSDCLQALLNADAVVDVPDEDGLTPLMIASWCGHTAGVQMLIEHGAAPSRRTENGVHAGYWAARNGNVDTLWALAAADDSILSLSGPEGASLLIASCLEAREKCVAWLLEQPEVNLQHREEDGTHALDAAAQAGSLPIVQSLLELDINLLNAPGFRGRSALLAAAASGHVKVVEWLLKQPGIDMHHYSENGAHALDSAAAAGHFAIAKALLAANPGLLNEGGFNGRTALIAAAANGHETIVSWLLRQANIDIRRQADDSTRALDAAAAEGHFGVVRALLTAMPWALNDPGKNGNTALIAAAVNGHEMILNWLLLQPGIDLTCRSIDGAHVLDAAVLACSLSTVQSLCKLAPELLNAPGQGRRTALILAASNGFEAEFSWLLEQPGIDVWKRSGNGTHALDAAAESGSLTIVKQLLVVEPGLLNEPGFDERTALIAAAINSHDAIATWLLEQPAIDVTHRENDGLHALDAAAQSGNLPIVKALLACAPELLNKPGFGGRSALTAAAVNNQQEIVEWLLGVPGADHRHPSLNGLRAHDAAAQAGSLSSLKLLFQRDQSLLNCTGLQGRTALIAAARNGHELVVAWLLAQPGTDLTTREIDGMHALDAAAQGGSLTIAKQILTREPGLLNQPGFAGRSALLAAAVSGHELVFSWLLRQPGVDLENRQSDGAHLLDGAAQGGSVKIVEQLLQRRPMLLNEPGFNERTALIAAAFKGSVSLVSLLLEQPAIDVRCRQSDGAHALDAAVTSGNRQVVEQLLIHDPDLLNEPGFEDGTALITAALAKQVPAVALLLSLSGVDYLHRNKNGAHAFDAAAQAGSLQTLRQLIHKDPGLLNLRGFDERTALICASYQGHEHIVAWLLKQSNIELDGRAKDGLHALDAAAHEGSLSIVSILLEYEPKLLNAPGQNDRTALVAAATNGHESVVEWLLDQPGIELGHRSKNGMHAFDGAAQEGCLAAMRLILQRDASLLNGRGFEDRTALIAAATSGHESVVEWLLDQPDIELGHRNRNGTQAFGGAAQAGSLRAMELLLSRDVSLLNAPGFEGRSALLAAAINGHESIVLWLLSQSDIDVQIRDASGSHVFDAAVCSGNLSLVQKLYREFPGLLNEPGGDGHRPLLWACLSSHELILNWLLEQPDLDLHTRSENGTHAFYAAAEAGSVPIARTLLDLHPDWLNAPAFEGRSALIGACVFARDEMVDWLLKLPGIDTRFRADTGMNALFVAAAAGSVLLVKKILEFDPELAAVRGPGESTVLMAAAMQGQENMVEWLLQQRVVDLYAQGENGMRAFEMTAFQGHLNVLKMLYSYDNNVLNTTGLLGCSALQAAIGMEQIEIAEWLLTLPGIDLRICSDDGDHALSQAAEMGNRKIAQLMLDMDPGLVVLPGEEGALAAAVARDNDHEELAVWLCDMELRYRNQSM